MKLFGIVNFEGNNIKIKEMEEYRPISAMSFLGRYRLIDAVISNMTNSGISTIQVYMNNQIRSLIDHLGAGKHYNINSKRGRLQLFTNDPNANVVYNNDINAFNYSLEAIESVNADYVVISPSFVFYSVNYNDVLDLHIKSKADITIISKKSSQANKKFLNCDCLEVNLKGRVTGTFVNHGKSKNSLVSLEAYIMSKAKFIELIKEAKSISSMYWLKDIIFENLKTNKVMAYQLKNECYCINSLEEYFWSNINLNNHLITAKIFNKNWPISTKTNDSPPTYYGSKAIVSDSIVSNGARINGDVKNCIIGRGVVVEEGAEVENCVLLADVTIKKGTKLSYAIVDKKATVSGKKDISGKENEIVYIKRKDVV